MYRQESKQNVKQSCVPNATSHFQDSKLSIAGLRCVNTILIGIPLRTTPETCNYAPISSRRVEHFP